MSEVFSKIVTAEFLFTTIRIMTPILYAAMTCMIFNKGGVDPIGTEGIMLFCSLAGVLGGFYTGSFILGMIFAMTVGAFFACIFVFVNNRMKSEAILAGIALNLLASGLTVFVIYYITGEKGSTQSLASPVAPNIAIPLIRDIPILGTIVSGHNLFTYLGFVLLILVNLVLFKMPLGLRIRSVGEAENAAQSVGINSIRYKYYTAILAGSMAGLGGSFMSMGYVSNFSHDMIAGRGFIGMAAEGMGRGMPLGIMLSSMLFGAADALSVRLQMLNFPSRLIQSIPYIVTIVAIAVYSSIEEKRKRTRSQRISI